MNNSQSVDNLVMYGQNKRKLSTYLTPMLRFTSSFRAAVAVRSGRTLKLLGALFALAATVTITMQPVNAATSSDYYKLYLHSKIINFKQYKCAITVGDLESRWNPSAINGNHYGIFQMNNKKVRYMNPFTQIDWWIKYITNRYDGSYCKALDHLKKRGWQ